MQRQTVNKLYPEEKRANLIDLGRPCLQLSDDGELIEALEVEATWPEVNYTPAILRSAAAR